MFTFNSHRLSRLRGIDKVLRNGCNSKRIPRYPFTRINAYTWKRFDEKMYSGTNFTTEFFVALTTFQHFAAHTGLLITI